MSTAVNISLAVYEVILFEIHTRNKRVGDARQSDGKGDAFNQAPIFNEKSEILNPVSLPPFAFSRFALCLPEIASVLFFSL